MSERAMNPPIDFNRVKCTLDKTGESQMVRLVEVKFEALEKEIKRVFSLAAFTKLQYTDEEGALVDISETAGLEIALRYAPPPFLKVTVCGFVRTVREVREECKVVPVPVPHAPPAAFDSDSETSRRSSTSTSTTAASDTASGREGRERREAQASGAASPGASKVTRSKVCNYWLQGTGCDSEKPGRPPCSFLHVLPAAWRCNNCLAVGKHRLLDCDVGYCAFFADGRCDFHKMHRGRKCPLNHLSKQEMDDLESARQSEAQGRTASVPEEGRAAAPAPAPVAAPTKGHASSLGAALTTSTTAVTAPVAAAGEKADKAGKSKKTKKVCSNCRSAEHTLAKCPQPCRFFQKGFCRSGDACKQLHPAAAAPASAAMTAAATEKAAAASAATNAQSQAKALQPVQSHPESNAHSAAQPRRLYAASTFPPAAPAAPAALAPLAVTVPAPQPAPGVAAQFSAAVPPLQTLAAFFAPSAPRAAVPHAMPPALPPGFDPRAMPSHLPQTEMDIYRAAQAAHAYAVQTMPYPYYPQAHAHLYPPYAYAAAGAPLSAASAGLPSLAPPPYSAVNGSAAALAGGTEEGEGDEDEGEEEEVDEDEEQQEQDNSEDGEQEQQEGVVEHAAVRVLSTAAAAPAVSASSAALPASAHTARPLAAGSLATAGAGAGAGTTALKAVNGIHAQHTQHTAAAHTSTDSAAAPRSKAYKTVECKYFLRGKCSKGEECTFIHPEGKPAIAAAGGAGGAGKSPLIDGRKCYLCAKSFNSAQQLAEHEAGKTHRFRLKLPHTGQNCYNCGELGHAIKDCKVGFCRRFANRECRYGADCALPHVALE